MVDLVDSQAVSAFRTHLIFSNEVSSRSQGIRYQIGKQYYYAVRRLTQKRTKELLYCSKCEAVMNPIGGVIEDVLTNDHIRVLFTCWGKVKSILPHWGARGVEVSVHDIAVEMGYPNDAPRTGWPVVRMRFCPYRWLVDKPMMRGWYLVGAIGGFLTGQWTFARILWRWHWKGKDTTDL